MKPHFPLFSLHFSYILLVFASFCYVFLCFFSLVTLSTLQAAAERGTAAATTDRQDAAGDQAPPVWEIPPMTVVFRLAGVDGEATEDMVETLL